MLDRHQMPQKIWDVLATFWKDLGFPVFLPLHGDLQIIAEGSLYEKNRCLQTYSVTEQPLLVLH